MNGDTALHTDNSDVARRGLAGWTIWLAGLVVALGAAVATAHGLYVVALAAGVPQPIAWLYPLITDGLALVAYAASARLTGAGRRYAWTVVVLAAGLSGLAQASYLAGGVGSAPTELRFGVGAWPAVAAAIVAHLLFLLSTHKDRGAHAQPFDAPVVRASNSNGVVQPNAVVHPRSMNPPVRTTRSARPMGPSVQPGGVQDVVRPGGAVVAPRSVSGVEAPARSRATEAAHEHLARHSAWPTVSRLMELAEVGRGTAGVVLKNLRGQANGAPANDDSRPQS